MTIERCGWCGKDQIYKDYHDTEWGEPLFDDAKLFELFILETLQAGLSWITVLKKRAAYRVALDDFDAEKIAQYDEEKINALMQHPELIKNRLKMHAIVHNAQCYLALQATGVTFSQWLWAYVEHTPIRNRFATLGDVPAKTPLSDQISKDLKQLGFKFVGSVTCYAFMQAAGLVNDHVAGCFKYQP